MSPDRLSWSTVKFTGIDGGPAYIDLSQVAAVTPAKGPGELAALGARVILTSGVALFTRESADTVFEEWRRARTLDEPPPPKMKVGDAAPAAEVPRDPPAPIAAPEPALIWREITESPGNTVSGKVAVYAITELWDLKHPQCPRDVANNFGGLRPGHRQYTTIYPAELPPTKPRP